MAIHVTPKGEGWQVKNAYAEKAHRIEETQQKAIEVAKREAKNKGTDTKIHGRDGQIRGGNSYGNDPYPPKDRNQ
ncbi:MAG: DUF2188 domain-containing protein [Clostridia bacterium]